ncbi:MAG: hypothetical protein JWM11_282 [Planctomycetaceae bacterium]|nr:hypothetical protein [Planctomycetaceae bacterium]
MRSGLYLTCGMLLLGGCAQSNWLQSAAYAPPDPSKSVIDVATKTPIRLAAYPGREPQSGLGGKTPWQASGFSRSDFNSGRSTDSESLESPTQPPPFENSGPQLRRVNRFAAGYSLPPGSDGPTTGALAPGFSVAPRDTAVVARSTNYGNQPNYSVPQPFDFDRTAELPRNGNGVINPPDWNPDTISAPPVRSTDFSNRSDLPMTVHGKSQISTAPTVRGYSQPIRQVEYSDANAPNANAEIPLRPGQALPGFTNLPPRSARTVIEEPNHDRAAHPVIPRFSETQPQSPADALKYLTSTTEREIATLSPGQTAKDLQYYIERHVYLRLLYLMAGQTEWALRPIPNIPAADQEFWTQVLWGVHSYFDLHQVPNPAERAAQTISQFNTAILRLKERAPLEIKNVVFSHKIDGYGEYETYNKDEFAPGQRVLVYAEVGNFHSELTTEGIYRTRLKSALQFSAADAPEELIENKTYPVTEDFCRNHRRDYFHSYVVDIPARCGKGKYVLKLILEDELSGKTAEYPLQFNVR